MAVRLPDFGRSVLRSGTDLPFTGTGAKDFLETTLYLLRLLGRHEVSGDSLEADLPAVGRNCEHVTRPQEIWRRGLGTF